MNCRQCLSRIFDDRDGTLSPREKEDLTAHLATCIRCRAELESEGQWTREFLESFSAATTSQSFSPDKARLARPETAVPSSVQANTNLQIGGKQRVFRWLAVAAGMAILLVAIFLGPFKPGKRDSFLAGRMNEGPPSLLSDDLPDPFQDWIEKRMIVTIEDKAAGTAANYLTDRTGTVRKISVPRRN